MADERRPYSRSEYNRALIANALTNPFNVAVLAGMLIAGLLLGAFAILLPVGVVVYGIAAARTYFDEDAAKKVLERERTSRRKDLEAGRPDPTTLAPPIRQLVEAGHQREDRIRDAIERAELPYSEVSQEVDRFVRAIDSTAARAQLLYEALAETPPQWVEQRMREVKNDPAKAELAEALARQHEVVGRMQAQLERFYTELERVLVELDTVRGNLVSVSASGEAANQQRLAADVRGLREEVGALAEGMSEAYEQPDVPAT
jgi:chromosome segregation ATPase